MFRFKFVPVFIAIVLLTSATVVFGVTLPSTKLEGHERKVQSVAFSPDGKLLASGSWDKTVKLWDVESEVCVATFRVGYSVNVVAFSPDGKLLASGSDGRRVDLWDVASKEHVATLKGDELIKHSYVVDELAFSADSKILAVGSWSNNEGTKVYIWDVQEREVIDIIFDYHGGSDVMFLPDSNNVLAILSQEDRAIKLRNIDGSLVDTLDIEEYRSRFAFSPDGSTLVFSDGVDGDGRLQARFWNMEEGRVVDTFVSGVKGRYTSTWGIAFAPNGKMLAIASQGIFKNRIVLWDLAIRDYSVVINQDATSIAFSPDSNLLAVSDDGVILYDISSINRGGIREIAQAVTPKGKLATTWGSVKSLK